MSPGQGAQQPRKKPGKKASPLSLVAFAHNEAAATTAMEIGAALRQQQRLSRDHWLALHAEAAKGSAGASHTWQGLLTLVFGVAIVALEEIAQSKPQQPAVPQAQS